MASDDPGSSPPLLLPPPTTGRLAAALAAYAVLALAAGITLDGVFRWAVWVFLGGLALKTWIVWRAARLP
jgi:hypothetical protein